MKIRHSASSYISVAWMFLLPILLLWSCGDSGGRQSATITGAPYEVVVVADNGVWDSEAGKAVRRLSGRAVPMLNSYEPVFDVMRIRPDAMKGITLKHRNILMLDIDTSVNSPVIGVSRDLYARPQLVIRIAGSDVDALAGYIGENEAAVLSIFENAERERGIARLKENHNKILGRRINDMFGFRMLAGSEFTERAHIADFFLWISREKPLTSEGVVIYTEPLELMNPNSLTVDKLIGLRNRSVGNIPGPSEGSYMKTGEFVEPTVEDVYVSGGKAVRMSGLWDVQGDFMGGAFVNYTIIDTLRRRIINIDLYVYAPDTPKRNMLRSLEHMVSTVEFTPALP